MRCSNCFAFLAALALLAGAVVPAEAGITVDGDLKDWGITINSTGKLVYDDTAYGSYTGSPIGDGLGVKGQTVFGGLTIWYHLEDSLDTDLPERGK